MASLGELKLKNQAKLRAWGLDVNEGLPLIEDLNEVTPRSASEVAARSCALGYVVGVGFGAKPEQLREDLERFELWTYVSAREQQILTVGPTAQDKIDCTWLTEAIQALAFCLGLAELLPDQNRDDNLADQFPLGENPSEFIDNASLRPLVEIQEQVDLHYRLHWYVRQCQLQATPPKLVDPGVVQERRRALDWAYGVEADWDEVPGDT